MNCMLFNCDGEIIRINLDNNSGEHESLNFLFRNLITDDEVDGEDPLPPLVESNPKYEDQHLTHGNATVESTKEIHQGTIPSYSTDAKEIKLFETAHLIVADGEDTLPHLIDVVTGEKVEVLTNISISCVKNTTVSKVHNLQ